MFSWLGLDRLLFHSLKYKLNTNCIRVFFFFCWIAPQSFLLTCTLLCPFMSAWCLDVFAVLAAAHLRLGAVGGLLSYQNTLTAEPTGQLDDDGSLVLLVFRDAPSPPTGLMLPPTIRADVFHRLRRGKEKKKESRRRRASVLNITCGPRYAWSAED